MILDSWTMVLEVDSEGAVGNGVSRSECVWRALESPNYRLVLAGYAGLMCYDLGRVPTRPASLDFTNSYRRRMVMREVGDAATVRQEVTECEYEQGRYGICPTAIPFH